MFIIQKCHVASHFTIVDDSLNTQRLILKVIKASSTFPAIYDRCEKSLQQAAVKTGPFRFVIVYDLRENVQKRGICISDR